MSQTISGPETAPTRDPSRPLATIPIEPDPRVSVSAPPVAPDPGPAPGAAAEAPEPQERRLPRIRSAIVFLLGLLALALAYEVLQAPLAPIDLLEAALAATLGIALIAHHRVTSGTASRRINRDASLTRILQGLSRSVSPESVVDAIVQELRATSGADHVVVARVRPDQVVEVTLVSARAAVPPSKTFLRPEIQATPTAPADEATLQAAADEIGRRVRGAYGLSTVLVEPLSNERRLIGALILSKRTRTAWTVEDRRLLDWAATEVSAAFGRAYAYEQAERGANIDPLTGLPNRRYFDELVAILRPGRRAGDRIGIVMVDVDRFKEVNDRHGHATGDVVLRAIAGAITASVRAEDTPARFGGEEFVVILRRASAGQAADVGERVRAAVAALPIDSLGLDEPVTVSVGVAIAGEGETEIRTVIERADRALYLAKQRGRDRVEVA